MKQKNKGITLIALVITIIVLLILAAVSIATLTGDEGILNQAENASSVSEKASIKEEVELALIAIKEKEYRENVKTANKKIDYLLEELNENYEFLDEFETEQVDSEEKEIEVKIDNSEYLFMHQKEGKKTYFTVNFETNEVKMLDGNDYEKTIYGKERTIIFKYNPNGPFIDKIIATYTLNSNKKIKIPELGNASTYQFIGWDTNQDGKVDVTKDETETRVLKDEEWWAIYISDGSSEITVENGVLSNGSNYGVYENNTRVEVNAEEMLNGKYFNGWSLDGGKSIVSTRKNFAFWLKCNTKITAIYGDNPVVAEPKIGLYNISRIRDSETGEDVCDLGIVFDCNITGYTLLSRGILRTYEENSISNLNLDTYSNDENVKINNGGESVESGNYTYSFNIGSTSDNKFKNIYLRGYLTYKAPDGTTNTIYTDVECLETLEK